MTGGTSGFPGSSQPRKRASNRGANAERRGEVGRLPTTRRDRRGEARAVQLSLFAELGELRPLPTTPQKRGALHGTIPPDARPEPPPAVSDVTGGALNAIEAARARRGWSLVFLGWHAESGARVCRDCCDRDPRGARAALDGEGFQMAIFRGPSEYSSPCRRCGAPVVGQISEHLDPGALRARWLAVQSGTCDQMDRGTSNPGTHAPRLTRHGVICTASRFEASNPNMR